MAEQPERSLFLETTIHILRRTGSNDQKARIALNLQERHVLTSTYVQAEYVNTFLRAAVDMHNLVVGAEDVLDACGRWNQERGGRYKLGIDALMIALVESGPDKGKVLKRLRVLIENDIPAWFAQDVEEITDATQCEAANYWPQKKGEVYVWTLKFPPAKAPEGLRQFLLDRMVQLDSIRQNIQSDDLHWRHVKEGLGKLLEGDFAVGIRVWQRLGDVIIALEAQACERDIYTTNRKHYGPICNALDLRLHEER